MVFQYRKLKNHCIFIVFFLDFYEKIKKNLRKYNGFVLPDVKNPNISSSSFGFSQKSKKNNNGNPKIQKSKTFTDVPKSFGLLDFWIFLKIVFLVSAL